MGEEEIRGRKETVEHFERFKAKHGFKGAVATRDEAAFGHMYGKDGSYK